MDITASVSWQDTTVVVSANHQNIRNVRKYLCKLRKQRWVCVYVSACRSEGHHERTNVKSG